MKGIKEILRPSVVASVMLLFLQVWSMRLVMHHKGHLNIYAIADRLMKGPPPYSCNVSIDSIYYKTDVNSLIHLNTSQDITEKRNDLIRSIWKSKGFPSKKLPSGIELDVPSPLPNLANLAGVDELNISMFEGRFKSVVYFFHPKVRTDHLIVFHQGHASNLDAYGARNTIQFFLNKGYSVLAFYMPLYGPNAKPPLTNHDQLGLLENDTFNPLQLFLEPVAVSLNYVRKNYQFKDTTMIGASGGGWTTTLYAAIDPSIQYSYPVAGTLPLYLTSQGPCKERRCWEDSRASLYSDIDYTELYILGAYGTGRKQIQVLNQFDSCCFYGIGYRTYEDIVRRRLSQIGPGTFRVLSDASFKNDHKISQYALSSLFESKFLKKKRRRGKHQQ